MPLYEYLCRDCENTAELLVRGSSDASATEQLECPDCGSTKLMKLLSVPAAPASASSGSQRSPQGPPPQGSCGSGCGCFPGG